MYRVYWGLLECLGTPLLLLRPIPIIRLLRPRRALLRPSSLSPPLRRCRSAPLQTGARTLCGGFQGRRREDDGEGVPGEGEGEARGGEIKGGSRGFRCWYFRGGERKRRGSGREDWGGERRGWEGGREDWSGGEGSRSVAREGSRRFWLGWDLESDLPCWSIEILRRSSLSRRGGHLARLEQDYRTSRFVARRPILETSYRSTAVTAVF